MATYDSVSVTGRGRCARRLRTILAFLPCALLLVCAMPSRMGVNLLRAQERPAATPEHDRATPDDGGQPTEQDKLQARAYMNEGERLFSAGDLEGALRSYQAGHEIMHVPTTGYEVARVQALLGDLVEADAVAAEVVAHPVAPNEPPVFGDARQKAQQLRDELDERMPKLFIEVSPAGATLFQGATQITGDTQSVPYRVNPGKVMITARAEGHLAGHAEVVLGERETRKIRLQLEPATLTPEVEQTSAPTPPNGDDDRLLRSYIGFGVGGLGFAVAGVTGVMSISAASDAREHCDGNECTAAARDDIDSSKTLANVANVGFVVGVLGAAYGAYEYFLNAPDEPTPSESAQAGIVAQPFVGVSADGRDALLGVSGAF